MRNILNFWGGVMEMKMEEIREKVKNLCKMQILCLQNLPSVKQPDEVILEALVGAFLAGMTYGINLARGEVKCDPEMSK